VRVAQSFSALLFGSVVYDDAAEAGQLNFQTPATEIMEKIVELHNDLFFFIITIVVFVS
jgi:heme/copper-type cytochrome/quinol oxidase subunit 2